MKSPNGYLTIVLSLTLTLLSNGACGSSPMIAKKAIKKAGGVASLRRVQDETPIDKCFQLIAIGRFAEARIILDSLERKGATTSDPRIKQLDDQLRCRIWSIDFDLDINKIREHTRTGLNQKGGALEFYYFRDTPYQTLKVEATNCSRQENTVDGGGNRILRAWPINGMPVHFHIQAIQIPTGWVIGNKFPVVSQLPAEVRPYLGITAEIDPTTVAAHQAASYFKRETLRETIENIQRSFPNYFTGTGRDFGPRSPLSNSENALQQKFMPTCWVASKALTATLRAMGIPARETLVLNRMNFQPTVAFTGYHATTEYYDPANGWLPLEPVDITNHPVPWTCNRNVPQQIVLATEVPAELEGPGTVVRAYYQMYNEGGNTTEALRNMTARLVSTPLFPPQR